MVTASTTALTVGQFELKQYQELGLNRLSAFLTELKTHQGNCADAWFQYCFKHHPQPQFTPWKERRDGLGNSIGHGCLMLPTGGGKTLVGALAVDKIQHELLGKGRGLVLWVVPSETIYRQTLKQFRNVSSPLHQVFKACAGGVSPKILEKTDRFTPQDLQESLCVMIITLQSFNVGTKAKEARKVYNPNSLYTSFFPKADDVLGHQQLKQVVTNLDIFAESDYAVFIRDWAEYPEVKASLANVFRLVQPLVVVDECHKTKTMKALENINTFNPSFILELSATPFNSNIVFQAHGRDLWREQMIKLPVHLDGWQGISWQQCLKQAYEKRRELEEHAEEIRYNYGTYIRPIMLIRVQRTGKDQLEAGYIHANDVEQWLLQQGVNPAEIAKRSSEEDDLGGIDLLSDTCSIRFIITKDALREGWDCPFAYVLCNLDNTRTDVSMVQMLGRILRQPNAKRIEPKAELNEAFVYCHNADVATLTNTIVEGLEKQGFGDIKKALIKESDGGAKVKKRIQRRECFTLEEVLLPTVLFHPRKAFNNPALPASLPLNWKEHLLPQVKFTALAVDVPTLVERHNFAHQDASLIGYGLGKKGNPQALEALQTRLNLNYLAPEKPTAIALYRQLYPIIPSAFIAHQLLGNHIHRIQEAHMPFDVMAGIKNEYQRQIFAQSEALFRQWLAEGVISFELVEQHAGKQSEAFRLGASYDVSLAEAEPTELSFENSLYTPMLADFFNGAETEVAGYLDRETSVKWWHRLFARQTSEYKLQGWQDRAIYPDFLVKKTLNPATGEGQYLLLETKGEQLLGNEDTRYKQTLLEILAQQYQVVGSLKTPRHMASLVLALEGGWKTELNTLLTVSV
jgi:type III restriction enzyme